MKAITTIKLQKKTKSALERLKDESESYDSAIIRLMSSANNSNLKAELIEAYKMMGNKDIELLQEWDQTSNEVRHYG